MKPGETINSKSYFQVLEEMHQKLSSKMPALVNRKKPILLYDNTKLNVPKKTFQTLSELEYKTLRISHIHLTLLQQISTFPNILTTS
uniref:Transposase n=1 Tax=Strongyloides venezuelensis TaxID=75913 RepID=A0A0K0F558_STRVS